MKTEHHQGFVLLEVLPALLLLMGALLISGRLLGIAIEAGERVARIEVTEHRIAGVWETWSEGGGTFALMQREAGGRWAVSTFPDEGWLPAPLPAAAGEAMLFRREEIRNDEGDAFWEISRLILDPAAPGSWQMVMRVLIPGTGPAEVPE